MRLPVLALFERSIRVESRSLIMCFARMALPVMILVSLFPVAAMARYAVFGSPGRDVFRSIAWLNFSVITLAGLSYFASVITEEKEELTLGLLRMTGLSPLAILAGKSTSRLVGSAFLLLVQFPFTLLAVTLGGVSNQQIVATYCALLAYTFLLCNLALLWSVVFQQTRIAATVTGICLGAFLILPVSASASLKGLAPILHYPIDRGAARLAISVCDMVTLASPVTALNRLLITGTTIVPLSGQVISNLAAGVGLFLLAWVVFEPCTREQKEAGPGRGFQFRRGGPRARVPPAVSGPAAVSWKDYQLNVGGRAGMGVKIAVMGVVCAVVASFPAFFRERVTREYVGGSMMVTTLVTLGVALAFDASRIFRDEVRWKTLSTLAVLPVSMPELAYRKIAGYIRGVLPILLYFGLGVLIYPDGFMKTFAAMLDGTEECLMLLLFILQLVLFLHMVAFFSLIVKRGALPLALGVHYFGGVFLTVPLGMLGAFRGLNFETGATLTLVVTLALIVALHRGIGNRLLRLSAEE